MLKYVVHMQNLLRNFVADPLRRDDRGVTAVEYGLIVAGIAALIVATVFILGRTLNGVFANINGAI
jgi:pilus assembly protein Flp/PilA